MNFQQKHFYPGFPFSCQLIEQEQLSSHAQAAYLVRDNQDEMI